jgi:exopolyphosphatase/guanosine-5'-triphosphate,3'-diphosphate pyrophosphatase
MDLDLDGDRDLGGAPIAVIDLGSNSGRMVVFRFREGGHLDVLEDARAPLRLGRSLRGSDSLGPDAIDRTIEALRDFCAVALGAGASRTLAVATSAIREAADGPVLIERARDEVGVDLRIIDGDREAAFGFLGAVHDLPVTDGVMMDVGGGSMELTRFIARRPVGSWTLPLGSLRLSDRYLSSDPPTDKELRKLGREAQKSLSESGIDKLAAGDELVGVGGTVRNLAKIDRRRVDYPLPLLHGYTLEVPRLREIVDGLAGRRMSRRAATPGLNPDRADTIVGGGVAVLAAMEALGAHQLLVSSRGLREGVALHQVTDELPAPSRVRSASMHTLALRFATWDPTSGARRSSIASRLLQELDPGATPELREMLDHAATIVDVGRAIDYYDRFEHAAMLITAADLGGFSHGDLGLLTGILRQAADDARLGPYRGLVEGPDREPVLRAATVLALADELNRRIPPGRRAEIDCGWAEEGFLVTAPVPPGWRPRGVALRFRRVFGPRLLVEASDGG